MIMSDERNSKNQMKVHFHIWTTALFESSAKIIKIFGFVHSVEEMLNYRNIILHTHVVQLNVTGKKTRSDKMKIIHKLFLYIGGAIQLQKQNSTNKVYNIMLDSLSHDEDLIRMYVRFSQIYQIIYLTYHDLYLMFDELAMFKISQPALFANTIQVTNQYTRMAVYMKNVMNYLKWTHHTLVTVNDETLKSATWQLHAFDHYWKLTTNMTIRHVKDLTSCWMKKKKIKNINLKSWTEEEDPEISQFIDYDCAFTKMLTTDRHKIFVLLQHSDENLEKALTAISKVLEDNKNDNVLQLEQIVIFLFLPNMDQIYFLSHFITKKAKNLYSNIVFLSFENPFDLLHQSFMEESEDGVRYGDYENFVISFRIGKIIYLLFDHMNKFLLEELPKLSSKSNEEIRMKLNEHLLEQFTNVKMGIFGHDEYVYFDKERISHDNLHMYQLTMLRKINEDNSLVIIPNEEYKINKVWKILQVGNIPFLEEKLNIYKVPNDNFRSIIFMLSEWEEEHYELIEKTGTYNIVITITGVIFMILSSTLLAFLLYYFYHLSLLIFKYKFNWWLRSDFLQEIEYADKEAVEEADALPLNSVRKTFGDTLRMKRYVLQEFLLFRQFNKIIDQNYTIETEKNRVYFELDEVFGENYEKHGTKNDKNMQVTIMPFTILHSRRSNLAFFGIDEDLYRKSILDSKLRSAPRTAKTPLQKSLANIRDSFSTAFTRHPQRKTETNNRLAHILRLSKKFQKECTTIRCQLKVLSSMNHLNCTKFFGVMPFQWNSPIYEYALLWERNPKGTLADFLMNDAVEMTCGFKSAILLDIIRGLEYIHGVLGYHGRMNIWNCNVGNKFEIKLTNFGFQTLLPNRTMQTEVWLPPDYTNDGLYSPDYDMYAYGLLSANVLMHSPKASKLKTIDNHLKLIDGNNFTRATTRAAVKKMNLIFSASKINSAFKEFLETKLKFEVVNTLITKHLSKRQLVKIYNHQRQEYSELENLSTRCLEMRVDSKLCRETVEKIAMGLDVIDKKHTEVLELMKNDDTGKHFQEDVKHLETLQLYYDEVVENNPRKSHGPNDYLRKKKEDSLVINYLLRRMKYYILKMELLAKHQNYEVIEATERTTNLLNMLLPAFISRRLQEGQLPKPELFPEATVCFSSIQNFNEIYTALRPKEVVRFLNELYNKMDKIIEKHQVFKVDSINEMFLMASGLPIRNGSEHVKEIGKLTLDLREVIGKCVLRIVNQKFAFMENKSVALGKVTNIRISFGVNTGEVVGGVVGAVLPRYTILGDTVNTSSRMLKYSSPNRILVTESTRILLNSFPTRKFLLIPREKFIVKGKGLMQTHWLEELGKTEKQLSEEYREDYERYLKFNDAQPTRDHGSSFGMRHSLRSLDADSKSKHQLEVMNMTKLNNTIKSNCQQKNKMLDAPIHTVVCPYGSNDIDRFTLFQLDYSLIAQDTLSYFDEKCSPQFNQKKISEILPDSRLGKHEQVDAAVCVKSYHDEDDTLKLQSLLPTTVPEAIAQKHFKRDALEKIVKFLWKTDVSETAETFANLFSRDRRKGKNEAENNDILTQIMNLNNSNLAGHRNVSSHSSSRSSKQASGLNRPRSATSQVIRNLKSAHTYGVTKPSKHYYTREALYLFYARLAYFYSYVQNDMIGFNE